MLNFKKCQKELLLISNIGNTRNWNINENPHSEKAGILCQSDSPGVKLCN